MRVSGLQKNYRKLKLSLYEENKAEAVQETERPKPWRVQKGRSRMDLQPNKFAETYIKKKKKKWGREEERQWNGFLYTTDLELQRGRCLMHAS